MFKTPWIQPSGFGKEKLHAVGWHSEKSRTYSVINQVFGWVRSHLPLLPRKQVKTRSSVKGAREKMSSGEASCKFRFPKLLAVSQHLRFLLLRFPN